MMMKEVTIYGLVILVLLIFTAGCSENFLDVTPEDQLHMANFWQDERDVQLALSGIYNVLQTNNYMYGYGPGFDALSPNAYQWASWEGDHQSVGNGSLTASTPFVENRWVYCYELITRANRFLENLDLVEISDDKKAMYRGEAHFLRGLTYSLLADEYGGVPVITSVITTEEARSLDRQTEEETWSQAIADFDVAIANLSTEAPQVGRADKGAALGMKMRAYLYQNKYKEVIDVAEEIEKLGTYDLSPSYRGLFLPDNENSQEVIFDVQFMSGDQAQGNGWLAHFAPSTEQLPGSNSVAPTQDLVDAYETLDGSPVDQTNPYDNRDPRLDLTIIRPGATYRGKLYPDEVPNHAGQRVGYSIRKYIDIPNSDVPSSYFQYPVNFIVIRYADVLLAKAEALIETGGSLTEAIALVNRVRTERVDVNMPPLPMNLSREEARERVRHERRIEFAFEGLYWSDIRRWEIGSEIYPLEIHAADGSLIETRFPGGYAARYDLLPIPDREMSLNNNLTQNPGW